MFTPTRFGRKLPLPSTVQIRHQLLQMMREDAVRQSLKDAAADPVLPVDPAVAAV
jgi:hypothetical protein